MFTSSSTTAASWSSRNLSASRPDPTEDDVLAELGEGRLDGQPLRGQIVDDEDVDRFVHEGSVHRISQERSIAISSSGSTGLAR